MDDQLNKDQAIAGTPKPSIDPLRRVFVPIERKTPAGTWVFRTLDREMYARAGDGSIRRVTPKVNGKVARKRRAQQRAQRGSKNVI
jgi:hypothetical protein